MIRLSGQVRCGSAADAAIVAQYLPEHIRLSRAEPGCLSFEVGQTEDPLIWSVEESFATRADFDAHQVRTKASVWYQATGHIPRVYEITEG